MGNNKTMDITDVDNIILRLDETVSLLGILSEDKDDLSEMIAKAENKEFSAEMVLAYIKQRLNSRMDSLLDLSIVITSDQAKNLNNYLNQENQRRKDNDNEGQTTNK
ncbi:hypothetical protein DY120_01875 [Apilactobacillus micheneri]|uniref:Uncharacterized protein n=1 Tax=Apilactobacillus micheneri TaxID=1899430 RepID=A0ABY2YZY5_9LACO|nr:hypothetical protein [Apilactobacillus micheneri]TPR26467.1 hypothetical protein DY114_01875 [Apilactobacillus micheneri]TPR27221.1 hypothetical protein DY111_01875 [Apilactobacillus micheneri]TPR27468.1 hypothetical protein DY113_06825 [Apilactobacillus micheneri]TPR31984.1 hypothetical protein DY117_01875 [Apilactobacillus micheneri]TPR32388.1 hypothetical protein DY120_01875 [Apilactobacillus micheneri]